MDPKERANWRHFLALRGIALGVCIAALSLVVDRFYGYNWVDKPWLIIVTLGVCVILIALSCIKSVYLPPDAEAVKAGIDKLKQDWERESKGLVERYKTRIQELQTQHEKMLEEGRKPRLIVVSWPGYTHQSIVEGFEDFKVSSIIYVRGIDRATRFSLDGELPDVLIVDVELQKLATEHEQLLKLDAEPELTEKFHTISHAIMALREIEPANFLPLRLGINGLAFSKQLWGRQTPDNYGVLFARDQCPRTSGADSIGVWNWYLPSMLLLFLAIGKKPDDIAELNFADTRDLLENLWQQLAECGFMSRITTFYNQVDSLITDLEHGRISLVLGGGGWAFRPSGSSGDLLVGTVNPREGVLVWLEGAVVLRKNQVKSRYAVQFLKKLLEDEVQKTLCLQGVYGGCPVNIETLRGFSRDGYGRQRSDCNNLFMQDFSSFESNIYVRKLPRQHKQWEAWWDRLIEECQTKYRAIIR